MGEMMELVSKLTSKEAEEYQKNGCLCQEALKNRIFCSRNAVWKVFGRLDASDLLVVTNRRSLKDLKKTMDTAGIESFCCRQLSEKQIVRIESADSVNRTCVLMNTSMISESWCRPALAPLIHADDEVCVLAFSFFDDTKNLDDWNRQYARGQGIWYRANTDVFFPYGLKENQIHWVNYFTDTKEQMEAAISNSSILLLTGGAPDLMMKRIKEKKLTRLLKNWQGLVIGYSAGAMIQLGDYHITPDEDYPEFKWCRGLCFQQDFDIEAHYHGTRHQNRHIERAISEKHLDTWAIEEKGGMIVGPKGKKSFFGAVHFFDGTAGTKQ